MDNEGNLLVASIGFLIVFAILYVLIRVVVKLGRFEMSVSKQVGLAVVFALIISVFIKFI